MENSSISPHRSLVCPPFSANITAYTTSFSPSCPFHHNHCCSAYLFYLNGLPARLQKQPRNRFRRKNNPPNLVDCFKRVLRSNVIQNICNKAVLKAVSMKIPFARVWDLVLLGVQAPNVMGSCFC